MVTAGTRKGLARPSVDQTIVLSSIFLLVASWKSYETAPSYGSQAKDGVRGKVVWPGKSSTRRRKPRSPLGAAEGADCAAGTTTTAASASRVIRRASMASPRFVGSVALALEQALEQCAGAEDESIVAPAPGDLDGGRKTVLRRAARDRQSRRAEHVQRPRQQGQLAAQLPLVLVRTGCDVRQSRRDEQVEAVHRLCELLAVALARPGACVVLRVRDVEAELDLRRDVLAVELRVLGVELAVRVRDLAHED